MLFAVIRFKQDIMERGICVGGSVAREIHVASDDSIIDIFPFSESIVDYLEKDLRIPVVDETQGKHWPPSCSEKPHVMLDLGKIWFLAR